MAISSFRPESYLTLTSAKEVPQTADEFESLINQDGIPDDVKTELRDIFYVASGDYAAPDNLQQYYEWVKTALPKFQSPKATATHARKFSSSAAAYTKPKVTVNPADIAPEDLNDMDVTRYTSLFYDQPTFMQSWLDVHDIGLMRNADGQMLTTEDLSQLELDEFRAVLITNHYLAETAMDALPLNTLEMRPETNPYAKGVRRVYTNNFADQGTSGRLAGKDGYISAEDILAYFPADLSAADRSSRIGEVCRIITMEVARDVEESDHASVNMQAKRAGVLLDSLSAKDNALTATIFLGLYQLSAPTAISVLEAWIKQTAHPTILESTKGRIRSQIGEAAILDMCQSLSPEAQRRWFPELFIPNDATPAERFELTQKFRAGQSVEIDPARSYPVDSVTDMAAFDRFLSGQTTRVRERYKSQETELRALLPQLAATPKFDQTTHILRPEYLALKDKFDAALLPFQLTTVENVLFHNKDVVNDFLASGEINALTELDVRQVKENILATIKMVQYAQELYEAGDFDAAKRFFALASSSTLVNQKAMQTLEALSVARKYKSYEKENDGAYKDTLDRLETTLTALSDTSFEISKAMYSGAPQDALAMVSVCMQRADSAFNNSVAKLESPADGRIHDAGWYLMTNNETMTTGLKMGAAFAVSTVAMVTVLFPLVALASASTTLFMLEAGVGSSVASAYGFAAEVLTFYAGGKAMSAASETIDHLGRGYSVSESVSRAAEKVTPDSYAEFVQEIVTSAISLGVLKSVTHGVQALVEAGMVSHPNAIYALGFIGEMIGMGTGETAVEAATYATGGKVVIMRDGVPHEVKSLRDILDPRHVGGNILGSFQTVLTYRIAGQLVADGRHPLSQHINNLNAKSEMLSMEQTTESLREQLLNTDNPAERDRLTGAILKAQEAALKKIIPLIRDSKDDASRQQVEQLLARTEVMQDAFDHRVELAKREGERGVDRTAGVEGTVVKDEMTVSRNGGESHDYHEVFNTKDGAWSRALELTQDRNIELSVFRDSDGRYRVISGSPKNAPTELFGGRAEYLGHTHPVGEVPLPSMIDMEITANQAHTQKKTVSTVVRGQDLQGNPVDITLTAKYENGKVSLTVNDQSSAAKAYSEEMPGVDADLRAAEAKINSPELTVQDRAEIGMKQAAAREDSTKKRVAPPESPSKNFDEALTFLKRNKKLGSSDLADFEGLTSHERYYLFQEAARLDPVVAIEEVWQYDLSLDQHETIALEMAKTENAYMLMEGSPPSLIDATKGFGVKDTAKIVEILKLCIANNAGREVASKLNRFKLTDQGTLDGIALSVVDDSPRSYFENQDKFGTPSEATVQEINQTVRTKWPNALKGTKWANIYQSGETSVDAVKVEKVPSPIQPELPPAAPEKPIEASTSVWNRYSTYGLLEIEFKNNGFNFTEPLNTLCPTITMEQRYQIAQMALETNVNHLINNIALYQLKGEYVVTLASTIAEQNPYDAIKLMGLEGNGINVDYSEQNQLCADLAIKLLQAHGSEIAPYLKGSIDFYSNPKWTVAVEKFASENPIYAFEHPDAFQLSPGRGFSEDLQYHLLLSVAAKEPILVSRSNLSGIGFGSAGMQYRLNIAKAAVRASPEAIYELANYKLGPDAQQEVRALNRELGRPD